MRVSKAWQWSVDASKLWLSQYSRQCDRILKVHLMVSIKHWNLCLIPVFPTVPQLWSMCEWKAWKVKERVLLLWLTAYKPLLDVIFLVPCPIKMSLTVWGEGQRRTHCCFFLWLTGYKLFLAFPSLKFLLFVTRSLCDVACLRSCCCCH